ncbi:MAG: glycerol-3-phosphate 1-O-acyltransferase PlsY [Phycisphaeraceae bacterium]|nr:glycerol-3-phosphate 1-O-acyltransferase PlsY [Phycisphaeraceae bacterium]
MNAWWPCLIGAYLVGSIPFGLLIGWTRGVDIRKAGSGNVGATNAGRVLGRKWGVLCFVLDVLKGLLPVLIAGAVMGWLGRRDLPAADTWRWLAVAAAAVVGHVFPVWLKFRGGKGVATSLGVLLGFYPVLTLPAVTALVVWVALVKTFHYVSLASIVAAVSLPVTLLIEGQIRRQAISYLTPYLVVTSLLALLVIVRHRSNIQRLLAGTESKVGQKRQ